MLSDLTLDLLFFWSLDYFAVFVDKASHCVLLTDLLNLAGQGLDLGTRLVDGLAKLLTSRVLRLEQLTIVLHCFVFTVGLTEQVKRLRSVRKVLHSALNWSGNHLLYFLNLARKPFVLIGLHGGILLVHFKIHSLFLDRLVIICPIHHLKKGFLLLRL